MPKKSKTNVKTSGDRPLYRPLWQGRGSRKIRRVIIKIGSAAITMPDGGANRKQIRKIASDCIALQEAGIEVIIVSSGAIQIGKEHLFSKHPSMAILQACSAIGQPLLVAQWQQAFAKKNIICAQVLLTHEDLGKRERFLNLRNTLITLIHKKIIPVINENDSVSFEEISVGDNDQLAAMVAEMLEADCLVMLTEADGLFLSAPKPSNDHSQPIKEIKWDQKFNKLDLGSKTAVGRGGMKTKLEAIRKVTPLGIPVLLGSYTKSQPVLRLFEQNGSFFEGAPLPKTEKRKRWLITTSRPNAKISIDRGAEKAIKNRGSLLASGITGITGKFKRGDSIQIWQADHHIATGLAEYDASDVEKIIGIKSTEIEKTIGYIHSDSVIHRNNLVILKKDHE